MNSILIGCITTFVVPPPLIHDEVASQQIASTLPTDMQSSLATGAVFYVTGLVTLTLWEEYVVPALKLRSIIPDIPRIDGQLTVKERNEPWITPLTSDQTLPYATIEQLKENDRRIGSRDGISQFITLEPLVHIRNVQEEVKEWSDMYGQPIIVYKKHRWL